MGRLTGGDPSLLRRINSAVVLHALRAADSATLTEVTRVTGLSRPTVEGVVEGLIETGLAVESAAEEGAARRQGRPARRFRFRAEAGHLLGLEIGPHRVAAILADLDGRVLGTGFKEITAEAPADERLERLRMTVADTLRRSGVARSSLWAVGVGTPGIVEADGTVRLGTALPGWTGLQLGERLRRSFKCPVLVENDANTAAVAEHWKGAATESDDVVFVLAGLSPGAGSLIGGRLHRGFGGAAGEIGALHLLGREATPEVLLSTTGEPLHPLDEQAVAEVFAHARGGDENARAAVDRFIRRLVHDVMALVLALDPEVVVVGGWAAGLDGVLVPLRQELERYCLRPPRVALSMLGEAAVATGALRLALDHVEEQLFAVESTVTARR
ncbi:ROK family protein [Streptomyces sp. SID4919]|uniref:Transcriptional regulator n=1 Tax=Streptomyces uncialis TaxID=1048205 RepID=A0A1Q4UYG4_9ACTN|nr:MULTISPECIES: ROK family transcriptional regulator [Streptomyces]MCX4662435.1 ROK family protein [Streptomyces uncialis]MYY12187.1 ROK family protein [Streptomyces sp. SID4919]OKH90640.1 transcriptional regulator [Streptomyces uncialis]WST71646.1 ROK family protein [Streptomyces uncialis]WTE09672.1 ROK family protein [Streptomyces uncialis]